MPLKDNSKPVPRRVLFEFHFNALFAAQPQHAGYAASPARVAKLRVPGKKRQQKRMPASAGTAPPVWPGACPLRFSPRIRLCWRCRVCAPLWGPE
jgi:hypothetical protein